MNKKTLIVGLVVAFALFETMAEPGGTYTLTGTEKSVSEIIRSDMEQYPELYQGESLSSYLSKFKGENRIGKRKLSPGDILVFPETDASLQLKKSSTETKPKAKEKEPELVVEETGSITVTAAWLAYGGTRKLWRTEKFSESYPNAGGYRYTFAEELDAKTAMISVWNQLGGRSSNPYLDDLVKIENKGYLEEYIWETDRTVDWEQPKNLRLENYKRWAQKNIPDHEPECRVTIK